MLYGVFFVVLLLNSACRSWSSPTPQEQSSGPNAMDPLPAPLTYELQFTDFSVPQVFLSKLAVCFACLYGILSASSFAPTDLDTDDLSYDLTNTSNVVETYPDGKNVQLKDRIWALETIIRSIGVGASSSNSFPARSFWYGPQKARGDVIRGRLVFDPSAPGDSKIASDGNVTSLRTRDDTASTKIAKLLGESLIVARFYEDTAPLTPISILLVAIRALKFAAVCRSDAEIPSTGVSFRIPIPGSPALVYYILPHPVVGSRPVFWSTVGSMTLQLLEWIRKENEDKKEEGGAWRECRAIAKWYDEGIAIPFAALYLQLETRPLPEIAGESMEIKDDEVFFAAANHAR